MGPLPSGATSYAGPRDLGGLAFLAFRGGGVESPEAELAIDDDRASSVSDVESTVGALLSRLASGMTTPETLDARVVGSLALWDLPDLRDVEVDAGAGTYCDIWGGMTGGKFCGPREGEAYAGLFGMKPDGNGAPSGSNIVWTGVCGATGGKSGDGWVGVWMRCASSALRKFPVVEPGGVPSGV